MKEQPPAMIDRRLDEDRRRGAGVIEYSPGGMERRDQSKDRRADANVNLLTFHVAGERYALETDHVSKVVPLNKIVPIPLAPNWCVGLMPIRAGVVSVMELAIKLGAREDPQPPDPEVPAIILKAQGCTKCLQIDALGDVIQVGAYLLEPPPPGLDVQLARHLGMIATLEGELLKVLDAASLARA